MTLPRCNARASEAWSFPPVVKKPIPRTHYSWLKIASKRLYNKIYSATHREQINARIRAARRTKTFVVTDQPWTHRTPGRIWGDD